LSRKCAPRVERHLVGREDWHNEVARLFLDIEDALSAEADEKRRAVLIRRLRRALNADAPPPD
jgi:metallo-beta-lactamase family protein